VAKEIIWVAQKEGYVSDNSNYKKFWFNYSTNVTDGDNPFTSSKLLLNGNSRFEFFDYAYYNYLQPNSHHTRTPSNGINIYSFCLFPEQHQPSGNCNFNVITFPILSVALSSAMFTYKISEIDPSIVKDSVDDIDVTTTINIRVYAVKQNILRIIHGMGSKAFQ
jgi:hypothetical protein